MPLSDLLGELAGEAAMEVVSKSFGSFFFFPLRVLGAVLLFLLDGGKRKFMVAYRYTGAKYYGVAVAVTIFITWLFYGLL